MEKKVTDFVGNLKNALGENLRSFIVYGSAATGEHYKHSDYNTLIVLANSDPSALKAMSKPVKKWVSAGQPVPLIFTRDAIVSSEDVFPMEYADIKENSSVLHGEDVFKKIRINPKNLRLEIERELKSKLIRLRQNFIMTGGKPKEIRVLLIRSISSFTAILKGVLRLYNIKAPAKKRDIVEAAPARLKLNKELFFDILSMKDGSKDVTDSGIEPIFGEYMKELERVAGLIDKF